MPDLNFKDKIYKIFLAIIRDAFYCLFVFLLITGMIEAFKPGFLLNCFNLSWLLGLLLTLGAITVLFSYPEIRVSRKIKLLCHSAVFLTSVIMGIIIIYFLREIGPWNILAGICSVFICYFFIILSIKEKYD
ncbi:hypothetical protein JW977_04520 [Candidatus Falkowbacteria bacterium]|nr:hypothetical protein [Candidatus Falkowbacteria bacterium]